jgi:hypothetical protein
MVRYQEYLLRLARTWIRAQLREQRKIVIAPRLRSVARSSAETNKELSRKERRPVFDRS